MKTLVATDYNPVSGITIEYWAHADGRLTVRGLQDVEPMFKQNQQEFNAHSSKSRTKFSKTEGLGVKVASIPTGLADNIRQEKGIDILTCTKKELDLILNDPDYCKIRTTPGRF